MFILHEIDGGTFSDAIKKFNNLVPEWPQLSQNHLEDGHWWLVYDVDNDGPPVAFAGLVEFSPFRNVGYLKRCLVLPDFHGHGLQYRLMLARELKAKQLGWTMLVSECGAGNSYSASNFLKAGFERIDPEQRWAKPDDQYFAKII
jgi:GNAT superfamily N-acetyltransferase